VTHFIARQVLKKEKFSHMPTLEPLGDQAETLWCGGRWSAYSPRYTRWLHQRRNRAVLEGDLDQG